MTTVGPIGAQCFISYHREDNDLFDGVVDRLATAIGGRFEAETGRSLQIFVDRDSIPGGGDWRERIAESIASATIFIPVITMRYFQSEACREELIAFYDGAVQLGVTDLILPVILAGRVNISANDPRSEVRLIERLNYRPIDEAVDSGYQSPEWKKAIRTLVTDVALGLASAEEAIARSEASAAGVESRLGAQVVADLAAEEVSAEPGTLTPADVEPTEDVGDILDLNTDFEKLTPRAESVGRLLSELGDVVRGLQPELDRIGSGTPQQQRAFLLRLAAAISPVAARLGAEGSELESGVRQVDKRLRGIVSELRSIEGPFAAQFRQQLTGPLRSMQTGESLEQMDSMVQTLTTFALLSVSLRKALQPAIRGIRSVRNAISIANSWTSLGAE